jgi:hypothetical protein
VWGGGGSVQSRAPRELALAAGPRQAGRAWEVEGSTVLALRRLGGGLGDQEDPTGENTGEA